MQLPFSPLLDSRKFLHLEQQSLARMGITWCFSESEPSSSHLQHDSGHLSSNSKLSFCETPEHFYLFRRNLSFSLDDEVSEF